MRTHHPNTEQAEVAKMLRDAARTLGRKRINELLPPHSAIWISDHDTGCQIWIRLCDDPSKSDISDICAWHGSIWYSSAYEFNDRGKLLGFNMETDFAEEPLCEFFNRVRDEMTERSANRVANEVAQEDAEERARAAKISHLRSLFEPVIK